jgi:hypothetical protein
MSFVSTIFSTFYSRKDKRNDINKDYKGEGTFERYNQVIGADLDVMNNLVDNLLINIYQPDTMLDRYVPFMESMTGYNTAENTLYIGDALALRRKVLAHILRLNQIRGTSKCYDLLFSMMGLSMVLTEFYGNYGFDSSITFDNPDRRFDSKCAKCSSYTIALTGSRPVNEEFERAVLSVVVYNQPINARLTSITYNGSPIEFVEEYLLQESSDFLLQEDLGKIII